MYCTCALMESEEASCTLEMMINGSIQQGCPTFFLGGPHSDLGHRWRATYQWRSIFMGGKKGAVGGAKGCGPWREARELTRGRGLFPLPWRGLKHHPI